MATDEPMKDAMSFSQVGIGTTSPTGVLDIVKAGTSSLSQLNIIGYNDEVAYTPGLAFKKSHHDTNGTMAQTIDTEVLGRIQFYGVNTGNAFNLASSIYVRQNAAAGAGTTPATMEFASSKFYFKGNVGIGTTTPVDMLDVVGSGIITANNVTNDTNKNAVLASHQYGNTADPEGFMMISTFASSALNRIDIGGGLASRNAATDIIFHTASALNTRTGTQRMSISSAGNIILGAAAANSTTIGATGDVNFVGTGGMAYGSMYTNADIAVVLTTQNVWYEIDAAQAWTTGKVHNCSFADPKITVTNAGTYLIQYTASSHISENAQEIKMGIMIDSTVTDDVAHGAAGMQKEGRSHRVYATLNDEGHQSGVAIIQLIAGKTVSLAAMNTTSADDTFTIGHGNLTVLQIAGATA